MNHQQIIHSPNTRYLISLVTEARSGFKKNYSLYPKLMMKIQLSRCLFFLEKSQLQKKGKIATINCTHGVIYD
jgi:hypothetical protein